ncbi:VCBS repeat-containing protein [Marinoscillum sp.]|uniref:VCBS repeat-containing protein n=1 Tax=Marinoscillum sp. TaxID=2024838 RepID=UPI003BADB22B
MTCTKFFTSSLIVLSLLMIACGPASSNQELLFMEMSMDQTGIAFINEVRDQEDFNIFNYRNFYNGGGVAIGDLNNDGWSDVYFTANMAANKLYLNKGNWRFEDITEKSGTAGARSWSTGVTMADVNGDGWLDIYVCNSGDLEGSNKTNELFINQGDLTFVESAAAFGLDDHGYSTHASFFDFDGDGDLDCYLLNNSFKSIDRVELFTQRRELRDTLGGDKLLRNDNGVFTDISAEAGIYGGAVGFGLGVSVSDLNGDMRPDLYIANDFWERDYLYFNRGDGTFSEEIVSRTDVVSGSSMGADVADLNNDGFPEIFTTEMLPPDNQRLKTMTRFDETNVKELKVKADYHIQVLQNCLHFNDGKGNFQELAALANTEASDWSWGALIFDMDNDGWKDIFVSNGILRDITSMDFASFASDRDNIKEIIQKEGKLDVNDLLAYLPSTSISNYAYINQGNRTFINRADSLGLGIPSFSNGSAYGDLDNDGDLDLVVNNINAPASVYRNNTDTLFGNAYLKVRFQGPGKNPFGIGARVTAYSGDKQQVLENFTSRGFQSAVEPVVNFGLGSLKTLDSLVVVWPDMKKQTMRNVAVNKVLTISHAEASQLFRETTQYTEPLYREVASATLIGNYRHTENDFNDFNHERLLPRKLSTQGPRVIEGDVNGDGKDDFILLGAFSDPDKVFLQESKGLFREKSQKSLLRDSIFESTCGVLFDLDKDGDLDLLIGSGGNEFNRGLDAHVLRYYDNNGRGEFNRSVERAPQAIGNFSCILAEDFDQDGDIDLFIGGRVIPGNYGLIPKSFLFRNDNGLWTNAEPQSLAGAGMVTDAVWSDFNGDNLKDLIVVGEWLQVSVYLNNGQGLEEVYAIPGTGGWWNRIEVADLDCDGMDDYVLGNWGLNTKFQASEARPLTMYVNDFDGNGKSEFILNWYPQAEVTSYPFASKMDLTGQIPGVKKKAVTYEQYAVSTYESLFDEKQRAQAMAYSASFLESAVLWSNGGDYQMEPLPLEAQVAPIYAIVADDLDSDGIMDLLLLGNFHGLKPEVGYQSANKGVFLKGEGNRAFTYMPNAQSGITVTGEVRDAVQLDIAGQKAILVARNNEEALLFSEARSESEK